MDASFFDFKFRNNDRNVHVINRISHVNKAVFKANVLTIILGEDRKWSLFDEDDGMQR
jgi:hypothetical protein